MKKGTARTDRKRTAVHSSALRGSWIDSGRLRTKAGDIYLEGTFGKVFGSIKLLCYNLCYPMCFTGIIDAKRQIRLALDGVVLTDSIRGPLHWNRLDPCAR